MTFKTQAFVSSRGACEVCGHSRVLAYGVCAPCWYNQGPEAKVETATACVALADVAARPMPSPKMLFQAELVHFASLAGAAHREDIVARAYEGEP